MDRIRRHSFLITLALMVWGAYLFVPATGARYVTVNLGGYRGIYNSAWLGNQVSLMTVVFLSLGGFYLVKNAIARDERTRFGEIIAATGVSNLEYMLGKWLSNFAALACMVGAILVMTAVMQFLRGEASAFDPIALLTPFAVVVLPALAFVAGLAVLFESLRWLKGGLGNVVYFFIWSAFCAVGVADLGKPRAFDILGVTQVVSNMVEGCARAVSDYVPWVGTHSFGFNIGPADKPRILKTFVWDGPSWSAEFLWERLVVIGIGLVAVLVASRLFGRFETGKVRPFQRKLRVADANSNAVSTSSTPQLAMLSYSQLQAPALRGAVLRFARLTASEIKLCLRGVSKWWHLVALGLIAACLFTPLSIAREMIFPFAWIWPLMIWSQLGARAQESGMAQIVDSATNPLTAHLPAELVAGIIIAMLAGIGIVPRLIVETDFPSIVGWLVGSLFIAALAVTLGTLSGGRRLFEVLYFLLWYLGLMNGVPFLDFSGIASGAGFQAHWGAITVVLLVAGVLGRWLKLGR